MLPSALFLLPLTIPFSPLDDKSRKISVPIAAPGTVHFFSAPIPSLAARVICPSFCMNLYSEPRSFVSKYLSASMLLVATLSAVEIWPQTLPSGNLRPLPVHSATTPVGPPFGVKSTIKPLLSPTLAFTSQSGPPMSSKPFIIASLPRIFTVRVHPGCIGSVYLPAICTLPPADAGKGPRNGAKAAGAKRAARRPMLRSCTAAVFECALPRVGL
mmetsp:Transcript_121766/g.190208  ORF Transcript_121766/g.190208 Transcript_121766/m.190208 type:complete len:214 (-) Transcript_121766:177-818(-)